MCAFLFNKSNQCFSNLKSTIFKGFKDSNIFINCFKGSKGEKGSSAHFPGFSRNIVHSSEVAGFPVNFIEGPPGPPGLPGKKVENLILLTVTHYQFSNLQ